MIEKVTTGDFQGMEKEKASLRNRIGELGSQLNEEGTEN